MKIQLLSGTFCFSPLERRPVFLKPLNRDSEQLDEQGEGVCEGVRVCSLSRPPLPSALTQHLLRRYRHTDEYLCESEG